MKYLVGVIIVILTIVLGTIFKYLRRLLYFIWFFKDDKTITYWRYRDGISNIKKDDWTSKKGYAGTEYTYKYPWDYVMQNMKYIESKNYNYSGDYV